MMAISMIIAELFIHLSREHASRIRCGKWIAQTFSGLENVTAAHPNFLFKRIFKLTPTVIGKNG